MADSEAVNEESPMISFNVKSAKEEKHTLEMPASTTIGELKTKLSELTSIPADSQRLIYSGRVMKDDDTLATYKVQSGNTIHLVKGAASNQRAAAGGNAGPSGASTAGANAAPRIPSNIAAGSGNNPLAGLTGARYAGLASLPNADIFGPDGGMGPPPDVDQMSNIMSTPGFQATMNELLQNPQMLDYIINSNPALRSIPGAREMMQSAEFRAMMTNPEMMRQASAMQRAFGGGRAAAPSFPAPGVTDTTPVPEGQQQPQQQANTPAGFPAANPFAAAGANPFAALFGAPPGGAQQGSQNPPPQHPLPGNPYASLANIFGNPSTAGAGAGGQPGQPGQLDWAAMAQMMQQLGGAPGAGAPGGAVPPAFNPFGLGMLAGLGGDGSGLGVPPAPVDNRPPEERYAEQLRQLNDMGFYDFDRNVAALRRSGGSVQGAIQHLLGD